ncbi:hypothetical protein D0T11_19620 [Hymenobacter rubripertinctus]|uniref:Uncharacterized protein n=1 Tax=Hymenobacter rubripertinctus TaxID=2029981 RepID=A0A418QLT0_9BACT|nr:hypothetical protein D0T11_19620 [Hymenobacter rubripertinctus]
MLAEVRRYFGLPQWELAAFLGVSSELVKHIEAGRRSLSGPVLLRLNELACLLPAHPESIAAVAPDSPGPSFAGPPEAAPVLARLDVCQHRAAQQRRQLARLTAALALARRWEQALPELLTTAPAPADTSAGAARRRRWLAARAQETADALGPAAAARYHLLRVRLEALEAEAAALRTLLPADV